jgi:SAM-dependent methyltransferase
MPTDTILDLGCGIGILAMSLKLLGYTVVGFDKYVFEPSTSYSVRDIDKLKRIWREQGLMIGAGDALGDMSTQEYDIVVSVAVIEHQPHLKAFMEGVISYVKPGGQIYIATPNGVNFLNRFRVLFGRAPMGNIKEFFSMGDLFTGHWREYTVDELKIVADLAGLGSVEAGNAQTVHPRLTRNWRKWHINLARLGGWLVSNTGDTNYLWARKPLGN